MKGSTFVHIQFGRAALDSSGVGPIIITTPDYENIPNIALIATPETPVELSYYEQEKPLYAIASTIPETTTFDYLIVSSR
jgi:hypothetical protein